MKPCECKRLVKSFLITNRMPFTQLTAQTRTWSKGLLFVTVHGWQPHPRWTYLKALCKAHGFRVEGLNAWGRA